MSTRSGEVWVFAEQEDGVIADISFELLGKGKELSEKLGVKLAAVLLGSKVAGLAQSLINRGADRVHVVEDAALEKYISLPYRRALTGIIEKLSPQIVLFGATHMGRDLAPAVASQLKCGLTADCTDLRIGDYTDKKTGEHFENLLQQIRPAFGGNIIATIVNARNWPQMATVREGVMKALPEVEATGEVVIHETDVSSMDVPVEIVEIIRKHSSVNLKGARIIVCGGAGVGSRENFELLHCLAEALGGAVGGSRAAVDLGYCEHERQIGQTGVTVRPALMISCGVSGAVQHLAGMQDSQKIIAINTDPSAPIFSVAHYGIVGDLNVVIPKLIKSLKA